MGDGDVKCKSKERGAEGRETRKGVCAGKLKKEREGGKDGGGIRIGMKQAQYCVTVLVLQGRE